MCGIAGFWQSHLAHSLEIATRMGIAIESRGPDDAGAWVDEAAGLALSHRRLAILDLSPAGHQPMHSPCGRYVLIYNGEIYNHEDLRRDLDSEGGGFEWRGHSDTETLLAALRHWGIEKTLKQLNGMFAFALWDTREQELFLARDRMGEKPLYYGRSGEVFLFGSELKALRVHPQWKGEIDRDALSLYMRHNYVPAPWSIYRGMAKLLPAHYVVIRNSGRDIGDPRCYWDLAEVAEKGAASASGEPEALEEELDQLLRDAVGRRMAADVPLGAFLSGGYDSTTVAAMMQAQSSRPVKTFTIGFHEEGYNEATHARAVADHLATDHTELYVTPEDAMAVIPKLPSMYDEPFSDSSQIPTFLVSQLARRHVTVSLSGDGGDELFYGYDRYFKANRIWGALSRVPMPVRQLMSAVAGRAPARSLERMMGMLPERMRISNFADRLPKLAELLAHPSGEAFYRELVSHAKNPGKLVLSANEPATLLSQPDRLPDLPGLRERMMYLDMMTYLPGDILTKVDRASMAVSLEARVPLLDHRVVEFAWRLPTEYKFRDGQGKWLLKQVLYRYVPRELMERPKMGFGVPVEHWLRGPLREWAEDLLSESRLAQEGFFDPAPIRQMWKEHVSGERRWHYHLWDVLMFQAWLSEQG
ncbi:asparagine synthase (glutamine-hydrolyzing) [Marinobacter sp.]|uniref:asparagine synthase (glutamine-hydrolyzing) n=1 Tax=Marinobacter sp. TaxID=50741 RepID=UPI00385124AE